MRLLNLWQKLGEHPSQQTKGDKIDTRDSDAERGQAEADGCDDQENEGKYGEPSLEAGDCQHSSERKVQNGCDTNRPHKQAIASIGGIEHRPSHRLLVGIG